MAKNEFLPFGTAEGANVLSNQEYERLAARFNGFISGVAKSKELNTVWRQSSVISSAIAQFIVDSDNKDLLDNGDVAGIKNRLVAAIKQTISGVGYVTTAAMNLELNKKIDKANISGVKGNDNDKVPSLNLFTTEIGKLQPSGNYIKLGEFGIGTKSSPPLTQYAKDWNKNGFFNGAINNSSSIVVGISCNHQDGLYSFNLYGRNNRVLFSTRENGVDSVIDGVFYTSENTTQDRNGYLRSSTSTVEMQAVPIGGSIIWNSTAPIPDNFWPNEGRAFSATEYPELAKIFPTLRLPDDRGYAIRMADNGKNIDIGRTVGTYQEDAQQKVEGEIIANIGGSATGAFSYKPNGTRAEGGLTPGGIWKLDTSTQVRTANETRMKNVAKILITRVK